MPERRRRLVNGRNACILLVMMKMLGVGIVSDWNWIWVFSPIWVPAAAMILTVIILSAIGVISFIIE